MPYVGSPPRTTAPIHAENQLQDMSLGSFLLPSIETIDGLYRSVKHDGLHGYVKPIEGLPHGSIFSSIDIDPSNKSKKKHQKLLYSEIMIEMTDYDGVTSKKTQKKQQVLLGGFYGILEIAMGTHDPSQSFIHLVEKNNNSFGDFHSQRQGQKRQTDYQPDGSLGELTRRDAVTNNHRPKQQHIRSSLETKKRKETKDHKCGFCECPGHTMHGKKCLSLQLQKPYICNMDDVVNL